MSCWVAPTIAAELWGVSLSDVHELMKLGQIPSRRDGTFSFVRLPNYSAQGQSLPLAQRPPTYSRMAFDSLDAISTPDPKDAGRADEENASHLDPELGPMPDEDPADNRIAGWRVGRAKAMKTRRGPKAVC